MFRTSWINALFDRNLRYFENILNIWLHMFGFSYKCNIAFEKDNYIDFYNLNGFILVLLTYFTTFFLDSSGNIW